MFRATLASLLFALTLPATAQTQLAPDDVANLVRGVATQLAADCPIADAGDQAAFDRCRKQLFGDSAFRRALRSTTLWGRQRNPTMALRDTNLTQFAPDVLAGIYVPLFMFTGQYSLDYNEREKLWLATLNVRFRNRLQPGQFPYPFWHEADKWGTYEDARTMLLWIEPKSVKIRTAQFSRQGPGEPTAPEARAQLPAFDGKWMWQDSHGRTQPAVTLFDGLFADDNPYKAQISATYREFAISLREGQCLSCHSPDNKGGMKRLVLLQTPAHAAAEISRTLREVEKDDMPIDENNTERPLDDTTKRIFLDKGRAFASAVEKAQAWERERTGKK